MTDLRDLLGISVPVVQAPMAGVQGSALAIAMCNAGGLGSLPCAMLGSGAVAPSWRQSGLCSAGVQVGTAYLLCPDACIVPR